MEFDGSVVRWRRQMVPDPYNPKLSRPADTWDGAEKVVLDGAAVLGSSSYALRAEERVQAIESKSLFLDDPFADVRRLDGISMTFDVAEPEFIVEAVPHADKSPFTGWQPVREVPLKGVDG